MEGLKRRFVEEPVMVMALVQAAIAMLVGFGLDWTADQVSLVLAFTAALLGFIAREQVTPMVKVDAHVDAEIRREVRRRSDQLLVSLTEEEAASLAELRARRDRLKAEIDQRG